MQKLSKQDVILKRVKASVKNGIKLLEKMNKGLIRKYGTQNKVVEMSARKIGKSVFSCYAGVTMCTTIPILGWF